MLINSGRPLAIGVPAGATHAGRRSVAFIAIKKWSFTERGRIRLLTRAVALKVSASTCAHSEISAGASRELG
jgi:hypothetical protein